jgi:transposase
MRVMAEGVLRSRLASYGQTLKRARGAAGPRPQVETLVARIKLDSDVDLTADVAPLLDLYESLSAYLKRLNSEIDERASSHEVCRRLMEVPGIGPICALSFYSAIEDPTRFRRSSDVAAYFGLVPRRYQSGEVSRTLGITKTGNKLTRTHLVTAAISFGRFAPDCALKEWYANLRERIGPRRASVALARKLSIVLLTIWKDGKRFERHPSKALPAPAFDG